STSEGLKVLSLLTDFLTSDGAICSDGAGGCFVAINVFGTDLVERGYFTHVDASGAPSAGFSVRGLLITDSPSSFGPGPRLAAGGPGVAYALVTPVLNSIGPQTVLQKLMADGTRPFGPNGIPVSPLNDDRIAPCSDGGFFLSSERIANGQVEAQVQ